MKLIKRAALYFLGLSLILLSGDLSLWGQEDHLAKFGINKLDEKIGAPEFTLRI